MFKKIKQEFLAKLNSKFETKISNSFYSETCAYNETKYLLMPVKYLNSKLKFNFLSNLEKYVKISLDEFFYKNKSYFGMPKSVDENVVQFALLDLKNSKSHLLKLPEKFQVVEKPTVNELTEKKPFDPDLDIKKVWHLPLIKESMQTPIRKSKKKSLKKKSLVKKAK